MGLQKKLNKRIIKRTIGSDYVYQIEYDEKYKGGNKFEEEGLSNSKSQIQNGTSETKKEISKEFKE